MLSAFDIRDHIATAISNGTSARTIHADGRWRDGHWLHLLRDRLAAILVEAGVPPNAPVALVARNTAVHVGTFAALVAERHPTVMIYATQSAAALAVDIANAGAAAVIATDEDWQAIQRAPTGDAAVIALAEDNGLPGFSVVDGKGVAPSWRERDPATGFEVLSSGTTGPAKRVPLSWATMTAAVAEAAESYAGSGERGTPTIFLHPLGSIAGPVYLLPALAAGQPIVVLTRFAVDSWADAVRDHKPVRASLPPAAVAMILADRTVGRDDLASLLLVAVGGGALPVDQQAAFEERFGCPVLPAFGATEFAGVIAHWTLEDYRHLATIKPGSAGRASRHVALRIVEQATGDPLPPGTIGRLEAKVDRLGPDWIATTDLAELDPDGFLYLRGRADGAINRGGFKVLPDKVAEVLRRHPAVADAAVVGREDARLGAVPVALVELRPGTSMTPPDLLAFARDRLLAHELPVEVRVAAALPRTASMKIALSEVKALLGV